MSDFLALTVPLFAFMLIPIWIPVIAVVSGAVLDRVRPRQLAPVEVAVQAAKHRAAPSLSGAAPVPVAA